jgi:hypothetical protein
MRKLAITAFALLAGLGLNASAFYFDGGVTGTTGPSGYRGSNLDFTLGFDSLDISPSMASYTSDLLHKTYHTYGLRVAKEETTYTYGAEAGATPEVNGYSNDYAGADITFSLMPGSGGHSRLTGPDARSYGGSGEGISRIDLGVSAKYTMHKLKTTGVDEKTNQAEGSFFAGAKIFMVNLAASYTGYSYSDKAFAPFVENVNGQNFAMYGVLPKASVNVKLDLPSQVPMVTPFVSYTGTKYNGATKNSSAYLFGAYIDLKMVTANMGWQIFDDGSKNHSYLTMGAGVKF